MDQEEAWTASSLFQVNRCSVRHLQPEQSRGKVVDLPGCGLNGLSGSKCCKTSEKVTPVHRMLPLFFRTLHVVTNRPQNTLS
ncbi:hypothetical protein ACPOL_6194 [Acidisarcina polymorpha]|uniref:Uncharacterized protein n=1 Tax=Acidisarcina polymorpha TaxID=2211140 RepID=A0A2Z5G8Y9_9BACT|nr:hypothetical protein ACPOL_6194 [Acidisarcina polymorpha]